MFKYYRFNDNFKSGFIESYLWFSNCHEFNDPFEFKLYTAEDITDEQIIEYYHLMRKLDKGRIESIVNGNIDAFIWSFRTFPDEFIDLFLKPFNARLNSFGICCFTEKIDNILLWSHYADSHKGVVIEYSKQKLDESILRSNSNISMTVIDEVDYSQDYPLIEISSDLESTANSIKKVVYTKSKDWDYESEIRIISNVQGKVYYDPKCIKAIYLGSRFEKEAEFEKLIEDSPISNNISIFKMTELKKKYKIEKKNYT